MFFNGVNRLLLRRRRASPSSSVISVTEPLSVTAADSGKTYSLDSAMARIDLPARGDISAGWTITMQCTVIGRYCVVQSGDVGAGALQFGGDDYDGILLDSLDATVGVIFSGTIYEITFASGTVMGYLD